MRNDYVTGNLPGSVQSLQVQRFQQALHLLCGLGGEADCPDGEFVVVASENPLDLDGILRAGFVGDRDLDVPQQLAVNPHCPDLGRADAVAVLAEVNVHLLQHGELVGRVK